MGAPYPHMALHQMAMEQEKERRWRQMQFDLNKRHCEALHKPCDYCKQPSTGTQYCKQCGGPRSTKGNT